MPEREPESDPNPDLVPIEERAIGTIHPFHDMRGQVARHISTPAQEAEELSRNLMWIALGGRARASCDELQETLEAIARNAEMLAEQVKDLDDPRDLRDELYAVEEGGDARE